MKLTARLVHNPNARLRSDGTGQIALRLYLQGQRATLDTGFSCTPKEWNDKKQVINGNPAATMAIQRIRRRIEDIHAGLVSSGRPFTLQDILSAYNAPQTETLFWDFARQQVREDAGKTPATKKQHESAIERLSAHNPRLRFSDITPAYVESLEKWLRRQPNFRGGALSSNYIELLLSRFSHYCAEAVRLEHMERNPAKNRKAKKEATTHVWLTLPEVERIAALPLTGTEEQVRDIYLFGCYTGLRFSDIRRLTAGNLESRDSGQWIVYTPAKTARKVATRVEIPVSTMFWGKGLEIFSRYASGKLPGVRVFTQVGNTAANKWLDKIARKAQIEKPVTFHSSRHSCAMNLLIQGWPIQAVSKVLGHTTLTTTQVYARMLPEQVGRIAQETFRKVK